MELKTNYNFYTKNAQQTLSRSQQGKQPLAVSFGAAKDITLEYILQNRLRLLPERMRQKVSLIVSKKNKISEMPTLRELHDQTYAKLLDCKTLSEAQNSYPEFREVLQANAVLKKQSANLRKITKTVPLEEFSLHILKERWGKAKTLNQIAEDLGVKDRSSIGWFLDKIRMPDLGKNYQTLLQASTPEGNELISLKVKAYNFFNQNRIIAHNRKIAQDPKTKEFQRKVSKEAWNRLPHIKKALSEFSKISDSKSRFDAFWKKYPEFAEEFGEMKKQSRKK